MARTAGRQAYASDSVTTTPERLIPMLFDRLVRDLVGGEQAITDGDREAANEQLCHAQLIVAELLASLDLEAWSGAPQLAQLYAWLMQQLLHANVNQDVELVQHCRRLVEPLAETWHAAAAEVARQRLRAVPVAERRSEIGEAV